MTKSTKTRFKKIFNFLFYAVLIVAVIFYFKRKVIVPKIETESLQLIDYKTKEKVAISSFEDKVVVLNFWQTWCGPCIGEMPSLNEMFTKWEDIQVVAVSNEEFTKVSKYIEAYPNILFLQIESMSAHGVSQYPTTYIFNKQNVKVYSKIGPQDWSDDNFISNLKKNWE